MDNIESSNDRSLFFVTKGLKKGHCLCGTILDFDKDYVYLLNEPCKIAISNVEIIPKENVVFDNKKGVYIIKTN